jgi:histidinol-phosphatase (PHP family)
MANMVQDFSLHTHTIGFDGRNTPMEMISRAGELGLLHIGISNHFIVHPNITKSRFYPFAIGGGYGAIYSSSFDEAIAKFEPHYAELNKLSENSGIKIYRGMELDYFDYPDWSHGVERMIKILQPDYIICASHFVEYAGELQNVHDMANADADARDKMIQSYWEKLARAAQTGVFNWMAHLDLPKKTGCGTDEKWVDVEQKTINEIAKSKTPIEINTSFYNRSGTEPYPSARILEMAAAANIPVLLSDDAHCAEHIGRYFDRGYEFAKSCGITKFLTCDAAIHKTH